MTSPDYRTSGAPLEMLDLYDVLPAPMQPEREDDPVTAIIRDSGRRLAVLIGLFFVALPAFIVCTTLFSLGAGLAVLVVGLFILVACLYVAGWSARMTKALLGYAGIDLPPTYYPASGPGFRKTAPAAGERPVVARPAARPGQLHRDHVLVLGRGQLGGRGPRRHHLLVLEPLSAR